MAFVHVPDVPLSHHLAPVFRHYICRPLAMPSFIFLCDSSVPSLPPQTACLKRTSNQTKPFDHGSLHLHVCEQREQLFSSLNRQANFRVPSVLVSSYIWVFLYNYFWNLWLTSLFFITVSYVFFFFAHSTNSCLSSVSPLPKSFSFFFSISHPFFFPQYCWVQRSVHVYVLVWTKVTSFPLPCPSSSVKYR